jgi:GNAT superfamily N-acetyltransferase
VVMTRKFCNDDAPVLWTLSTLPNIGYTADPHMPLRLPPAAAAPPQFPDLADVDGAFTQAGGAFLVAEHDGHLVGMGGFRPNAAGQAEVLRVRTHPAMRRSGIGRLLMTGLESLARDHGYTETFLDTATNQPEAVAFYQALGYREVGRETRPEWSWTLVYFTKPLP